MILPDLLHRASVNVYLFYSKLMTYLMLLSVSVLASKVQDEFSICSVGLVTNLYFAKTTALIEMPFAIVDQVGPTYHVLDGSSSPP